MRRRSAVIAMSAAALAAATLATSPAASAGPAPRLTPVGGDFVSPLHIAIGRDGALYVADAFTASIQRVVLRTGERTTFYQGTQPVPGVDNRYGSTYATLSIGIRPSSRRRRWCASTRRARGRSSATCCSTRSPTTRTGRTRPRRTRARTRTRCWRCRAGWRGRCGRERPPGRASRRSARSRAFPTPTAGGCQHEQQRRHVAATRCRPTSSSGLTATSTSRVSAPRSRATSTRSMRAPASHRPDVGRPPAAHRHRGLLARHDLRVVDLRRPGAGDPARRQRQRGGRSWCHRCRDRRTACSWSARCRSSGGPGAVYKVSH